MAKSKISCYKLELTTTDKYKIFKFSLPVAPFVDKI